MESDPTILSRLKVAEAFELHRLTGRPDEQKVDIMLNKFNTDETFRAALQDPDRRSEIEHETARRFEKAPAANMLFAMLTYAELKRQRQDTPRIIGRMTLGLHLTRYRRRHPEIRSAIDEHKI